jgi:hypothetical protein
MIERKIFKKGRYLALKKIFRWTLKKKVRKKEKKFFFDSKLALF